MAQGKVRNGGGDAGSSRRGRGPSRSELASLRPEPDASLPGAEPAQPGASPAGRIERAGYVALAGEPNVGKSTLMNRFLEQRIAIVTAKPQTTRRRTLGVLTRDRYQMVLLDTPGLMDARYDLHRAMLREATDALRDADVVTLLVEPDTRSEVPAPIAAAPGKKVLAVNKIDTIASRDQLLPVLTRYAEMRIFDELVPISALTGEGVDELLGTLAALLPSGDAFYPPEQIADQPERFFVAEIIRERLFELYEREVPYSSEVVIAEFKERSGAKDFIEAWIYVETESQKKIVVGKKGRAIRALGEEARQAVESFLERPVYLSLRVRVLPRWRRREGALRRLGYRA
jgi:GTP-binding protein Era